MNLKPLVDKYFWTVNLVFLALAAWLVAGTVNAVIAHKIRPKIVLAAEKSSRRTEAKTQIIENNNIIVEKNFFGSAMEKPEPISEPQPQDTTGDQDGSEAQPSDLRANLVGTIVASEKAWSMAMITDLNKSETALYRTYDTVMDEATIVAIQSRRVILKRHGRLEFLELKETGKKSQSSVASAPPPPSSPSTLGAGIKKTGASSWSIERQEVENALSNLNNIAMQARIVPSFTNGVADGFKLFAIRPDSIYARLGIQNGDVIHKINGFNIDSPDKALEVYQKLKNARSIEIELTRMGKPEKLTYTIE